MNNITPNPLKGALPLNPLKGNFTVVKLFRPMHLKAPFRGLGVKSPLGDLGVKMWISIIFLLCLSASLSAQEIAAPLDIPLRLSGNFGELRNDHFHSGIDLKTNGVTGLPVKAVKAGYIARISVSPFGFGRAIYINHPDGTISVCGHLERFADKIESAVRDSQYVKESFSVNLNFSAGEFPVKQGEIVAYSGNTGASNGAHLHFELRNADTGKLIDPLLVLKSQIKDSLPPEIWGLSFYPQPGKGIVNGSIEKQFIGIVKDKTGKITLAKPVKAWGLIGIGIKAFDKMDSTSNSYGVKEIRLRINNVEVFHSVMDGFFFEESRYLNSFIDWEEWKTHKSFFMKSFIDPGNKLGIYRSRQSGLISVQESKEYNCEYYLRDAYGNTTTFTFTITGEESLIPEEKKEGILFPYNQNNQYKGKGIELNVPSGNLYTDIYLNPEAENNPVRVAPSFAPLYSFGIKTPLHGSCPLSLAITNDSYSDKSKYGIVSIINNKYNWLGGIYESHKLKTLIRELGQFTIAIDTVPPTVIPVNQARWTTNKRIAFKVIDDLSGIDYYQGRLDGKFALFEYDAKTNSIFCKYDATRMKRGKQTLTLTVRDGVKNETQVSYEVGF